MKCPKCWSNRAGRRETSGLTGAMFAALLVAPMECGQCGHEFCVTKFAINESEIVSKRGTSSGRAPRRRSAVNERNVNEPRHKSLNL